MDIPGWASAVAAAAVGLVIGWGQLATGHQVTHLGMPDFRPSTGRSSRTGGGP